MYAYNPRKKSYQQLEKSMVGNDRWDILNSILKEINIKKNEGPKQHWMIIGPRGIGKSHLMTLLFHKVKDNQKLSKKWVPILFPEELKLAGALHKILERTLNEIILEIELKEKEKSIATELKQRIQDIKSVPSSERTNIFFDLLSWFYNETGKHTLLIAENLQRLLGKKIPVIEQKKLRAFLQTSDALLIIGSATTVFNALHDHGHPFYHFFHIRRLEDLGFKDMKTLVLDILSQRQQPGLKSKVTDGNARLKAIYSFTGGNPRMAVFLADILSTEVPGEMLELMDSILDELTPYFESILQGIADCFEEVINTLAAFEPAQSPSEIAKHLEMPQASIRNYLKQLKEDGHVRIAFSKGKSNYYCLKEYLYRIWFQMRDSSHREETRWLIELLLMVYSREYIVEEKSRLEACIEAEPGFLHYKKLINDAVQYMERNPFNCKVIEWCVDSILTDKKKTTEINAKVQNLLKEAKSYMDSQQYDHAIRLCEEVVNINSKTDAGYILWGFCLDNQGKHEEATEKFKKATELNPKWDIAFLTYGYYLGKQGKYEEAIKNLKKAIELDPKSEMGYWGWGLALQEQGRYDDALKLFEKAIGIKPKNSLVYLSYGQLMERRKDKVSALSAYLSQIKLVYEKSVSDNDFQEIYNQHIAPLLSKLKPSKYIEQFFESEKKKRSNLKLIILLILLAQYDIIRDPVLDIFKEYLDKKGKDKREFELLIFTIKLSIWLKLIDENLNDALKANELYIEYIKTLKTIKEKENEVLNFSLDLFTIQTKYDIEAENVRNILKRLEDEEEIPFSNVIFKVWTCLSEPDSVEAQRYLNEKPIAEVVKLLKERVKSQKGDKKHYTPIRKSQRRNQKSNKNSRKK